MTLNSTTISSDLSQLGLCPNEEWLKACLEHLGNSSSADDVLEEVLHTELRLVVRGLTAEGAVSLTSASATLLKDAIAESIPSSMEGDGQNIFKANLPGSFRCLAQIEELLDVSQNAETRLRYGPSNSNDPTPIGNQSSRCLKMLLSDGYNDCPIVATEVSPIRNLSVHSNAGIKILLKGPIDVRCGILLLHEGNCIVLGGFVENLIEVQKKAVEQARKAACVGQDATIRALVSNNGDVVEDNDEEGEEASSDQRPTVQSNNSDQSPSNFFNAPPRDQRDIPQPRQEQIILDASSLNVDQTFRDVPCIPPVPTTTNSNLSSNGDRSTKPYGSSYRQNSSKSHESVSKSSTRKELATPSNINPYASSVASNTSISTSICATSKNIADKSSRSESRQYVPTEHNTVDLSLSLSPIGKSTPSSQPNIYTPALSSPLTSVSPTALTLPLSFAEFLVILDNIRNDLNSYKSYESKVFVVPAKMKGALKLFNIEKIKKRKDKKSKGEKQYGYTITCNVVGVPESKRRITCKLASNVLEPFFSLSPGELRQLSKTDKKKSEEITQAGGTKMCSVLQKLGSMSIKLMLQQEDFCSKGLPHFDDDQAYLLVTNRE